MLPNNLQRINSDNETYQLDIDSRTVRSIVICETYLCSGESDDNWIRGIRQITNTLVEHDSESDTF